MSEGKKPKSWIVTVLISGGALAYALLVFLPIQKSIAGLRSDLRERRGYVRKSASPAYEAIFGLVYDTLENLENATEENPPDIVFASYNPVRPAIPETNAVLGVSERFQADKVLQGAVVAENHPFMADLNWQSLVCRSSMSVPRTEGDEVLLWQSDRPLIMLRRAGAYRQLIFNFDLTASNAERLPAFIVLLHRFAEFVRRFC